jgi:putative oxidoreductase
MDLEDETTIGKDNLMNTRTATIHETKPSSQAINLGLWAVQLGVASMFFMAGWSKISGNPQMIGLFEAIGMGQWFRLLTGSLEILGAALLLVPALAGVGGLLLTGVMAGAVATHLFVIGGDATMAIVLFGASVLVAVGRKDRTVNLLARN